MKTLQFFTLLALLLPTFVKAQVQCGSVASTLEGCPPLTVSFTDNSSGSPNSYCWDFGGGLAPSTQANVTYTFTNPGTYNVKHCVSNGTSSDSCYIQIHVFLPPTVNFTAPDGRGCISPCHTVHFQNQTVAGESGIVDYTWNWGDATLPLTLTSAADTSHCYNAVGAYAVTLVARDSNTCQSTKTLNAVKIGNHPNVTASASPTQSCTSPVVISFTANGNTPNGGPLTYTWHLGAGTTMLQQNPLKVFFNGIYDPMVIVADTLGCTDTAQLHVEVTPVKAGFDTTMIANACAKGIQFTDTSNYATSWLWNFGDGTTATQQNPFHTYSSTGSYTVTLTVSYNGCLNSITRPITATSNSSIDFFVLSSFALCPPFPVQFYNSGDSSLSYFWDFGDSSVSTAHQPLHVYTHPGNYDVMLIVVDSTGTCSDTVTEDNFIRVRGPIGNFSLTPDSGNVPLTVTITGTMSNTESYIVDMGNGVVFFDSLPAQYTYMQGGTYYPVITLTDSLGCTIAYLVDTVICTGSISVQDINTTTFKLYPNPAGETLVIELAEETDTRLQVYNVLGQEVLNKALSTKTTMLNIAHLPKGIYRVSVAEHGIIPGASLFIKQ